MELMLSLNPRDTKKELSNIKKCVLMFADALVAKKNAKR